MMEGMNVDNNLEEYLWAMRSSSLRLTDKEWKRRPSSHDKFKIRKLKKRGLSECKLTAEDYYTKILATLLPDEVINDIDNYDIRQYEAVFLFADVSGFTDLTERYTSKGEGGPSKLTHILNDYIGSMVQEVLSHYGDLLNFSGDAFLAMWKTGKESSMQDIVHEALDCAIILQKSYGTYVTDINITLKVKLAIAAGHAAFSVIGDENMADYIVVGEPILEVKQAEYRCVAGEILVTQSTWKYVNENEYTYKIMKDKHIKVTGIGVAWRIPPVKYEKREFAREESSITSNINYETYDKIANVQEFDIAHSLFNMSGEKDHLSNNNYYLRPMINKAVCEGLKEKLEKFIIPPILTGLEVGEPLEYLTEMRQVVILFINVVTDCLQSRKLIELVNESYIIVCRLVCKVQGCVNKVSVFDKDLVFLVVFGLRGYKRDLESQIGLRCAEEIRTSIAQLKNVRSASVGVTTGMTYCGVVGHALRREYTVISSHVNKAARLMIAYPNKVTCDSETFIHSKMDTSNFIIQENKYLKGFSNVGPIYEFKEQAEIQGIVRAVSCYPLIGRDLEMKLFLKLLVRCAKKSNPESTNRRSPNSTSYTYTALRINGEVRQGKTRLLDELIYITPQHIPINRICLTAVDYKVPYRTIQLIFALPMGLQASSDIKERESQIKHYMRNLTTPDLLCALNEVFSVNFPISEAYHSITNRQRKTVQLKLVRYLCYKCFPVFWLIAIDDSEFIDAESWCYIQDIIDWGIMFFIMTHGMKCMITALSQISIHKERIFDTKLGPIDKWFHVGIACQLLDVWAISPEIEKVIQSRSNGNPGWIESFLVSLMQAGGIFLKKYKKHEIHEMDLLEVPIEMMIRLDSDIRHQLVNEGYFNLIASQSSGDEDEKEQKWRQYLFNSQEDTLIMKKQKLRRQFINLDDYLPVCVLKSNFNLESVCPEVNVDVINLKIYDSLSTYEQTILKCASVIGDTFTRNMLNYLKSDNLYRQTALAIKQLFEVRVFGCAEGDFTKETPILKFNNRTTDPYADIGIVCKCKGTKIYECCMDLPKYASCGYLRFRLPTFRTMTYSMLTDNQKQLYHNKAIRYIEKETRQCNACGGGYFTRILRARSDGMKIRRFSHSSNKRVKSNTKKRTWPGLLKKGIQFCKSFNKSRSHLGQQMSAAGSQTSFATFPFNDMRNCQCLLILMTTYSSILEHSAKIGKQDTIIDIILKYASLCMLSNNNIPDAFRVLREAKNTIDSNSKFNDEENNLTWVSHLAKGKIYILTGACQMKLGQFDDAYQTFFQALSEFGCSFPTHQITRKLKIMFQLMKQKIAFNICPNTCIGIVKDDDAELCDHIAECLNYMCTLFREMKFWSSAELAATWSLNNYLRSDVSFQGLCESYTNMILIHLHNNKFNIFKLERMALELIHYKKTRLEYEEFSAVIELYIAVFKLKIHRSELENVINLGIIVNNLSSSINLIYTKITITPWMVQALIMQKRISETVATLKELQFLSEDSLSGQVWFHALCIVLNLRTGYTVVPIQKCEHFLSKIGENTIRNSEVADYFYATLWLWYIRNDLREEGLKWYSKLTNLLATANDKHISITNIFTLLNVLEGLIIYIVFYANTKNTEGIMSTNKNIKTLITVLKKSTKRAKITMPRFHHLRTYFHQVKYFDESYKKNLAYGIKLATKYGNTLEALWMSHNKKMWSGTLPPTQLYLWNDHCEPNNYKNWHEDEMPDSVLPLYSLPLPRLSPEIL